LTEILLGLRVALKVLAASPSAGFSRALYAITSPLVVPFQGVFPNPHTHGSIFELSTVLAMLIYAILAWVIVRILLVVNRRAPTPTV
jgi:YGGT family